MLTYFKLQEVFADLFVWGVVAKNFMRKNLA